jgi:hypothetical protein
MMMSFRQEIHPARERGHDFITTARPFGQARPDMLRIVSITWVATHGPSLALSSVAQRAKALACPDRAIPDRPTEQRVNGAECG